MTENNQKQQIAEQMQKQRCINGLKQLCVVAKSLEYFTGKNYEDKLREIALLIKNGKLDEAQLRMLGLNDYFKKIQANIKAERKNYISQVQKVLDEMNEKIKKIKENYKNSINNPSVAD